MNYQEFLANRLHVGADHGFAPTFLPAFLFDFQSALVDWATRKGRAAIFADCGLGKTPMQLVWSENVVRHTNKPVLILTPLAVGAQTASEAEKFGVEASRSSDGKTGSPKVYITNYERLHNFDPAAFGGVCCDESSILKNFDGKTKDAVTQFMRKVPYRLLCTATAAPNDFVELGTSSEALGYLGHMDMLSKFFKNDQGTNHPNRNYSGGKWRFRGHAERDFWRWVCSWARAVRKPSDLGFDDGRFVLPHLEVRNFTVSAKIRRDGFLFDLPAIGLREEREENRRTLRERCEMAAEIANSHKTPTVCWCELNDESALLSELIEGAVEVSGSDSDEKKEEKFLAFQSGQIRALVTKPVIAGFGLNWQHCNRQTFFPTHSFEQWYQCVRRCWRFGQQKPVIVDVVSAEGQAKVLANLQRKQVAAEEMFSRLVALMNNELAILKNSNFTKKEEVPSWL